MINTMIRLTVTLFLIDHLPSFSMVFQMSDDREQKSENRGQKTDDRIGKYHSIDFQLFIRLNSMALTSSYLQSRFSCEPWFIYPQLFEKSNQPLVSSEDPSESFKCLMNTFSYFLLANPSRMLIATDLDERLI